LRDGKSEAIRLPIPEDARSGPIHVQRLEGRYADKQRRNARRLRMEKFARLGVRSSTKKRDGLWPKGSVSLFFMLKLAVFDNDG